MSKIGFPNLASINGPGGKKSFTGPIRTDGVCIDFICARPVKKCSSRTTPASIRNDIGNLSEAVVWGVDPGIREVFVASDGTAKEKHRLRRTSTAEYYQLAGFKKYVITHSKYGALHPQERTIVANSPTLKISSTTQFKDAAIYILTNFKSITNYYDRDLWQNRARFKKHISKQKASVEISTRLLDGSSKYQPSVAPTQVTLTSKKDKWRSADPMDLPDERRKTIKLPGIK
jgi:hypothetical protein